MSDALDDVVNNLANELMGNGCIEINDNAKERIKLAIMAYIKAHDGWQIAPLAAAQSPDSAWPPAS